MHPPYTSSNNATYQRRHHLTFRRAKFRYKVTIGGNSGRDSSSDVSRTSRIWDDGTTKASNLDMVHTGRNKDSRIQ